MKNKKKQPETVEQAAYEYSLLTAGQSDAEDDFIAGATWQASQHSYIEQKVSQAFDEVCHVLRPEFNENQITVIKNLSA